MENMLMETLILYSRAECLGLFGSLRVNSRIFHGNLK
jgi:hypothetical protein